MEKEFVPFDLTVKLKDLELDFKSLGGYVDGELFLWQDNDTTSFIHCEIEAPLWQQAFDGLWNKYSVWSTITPFNPNKNIWEIIIYYKVNSEYNDDTEHLTTSYEEARLSCLEKLIEIVENKKQ